MKGISVEFRELIWSLLACAVLCGAGYTEDDRTPRAGEAYSTTLLEMPVEVAARDRTRVTAINLGLYQIPDGPEDQKSSPFGAVFLWRNWENGQERLRGIFSGLYDQVRYSTTPVFLQGAEIILTFENVTVPFDRAEYIEGQRIDSEELKWHEIQTGIGLGYRVPLSPGHQDNALEAALTYEPGLLLFDEGDETDPSFQVPKDTYEGRIHFRLRADAIERNLLELPHRGFAAGLDGWYGRRADWRDWGGPVSGFQSGDTGREWLAASGYAVAVMGPPFSDGERHRLIGSAYGGTGKDLDRFSAFRLGGGPASGEWEALSHPNLPGAAFGEFFPRRYAILNLVYRYEVLPFFYPELRGSLAWVDRSRFQEGGTVVNRMEALHSIGGAVTSGFFWNSTLELGYAYNFGILRDKIGTPESGRQALSASWTKEF